MFCSLVSVSSLDFQRVMVVCCLLSWPAQLVCSRGMAAGVETRILGEVGGRKVGREVLCDLLGMGSDRKWRPQKVFCHRSVGIGSQDQKERYGSAFSLLVLGGVVLQR